MTPDDRRHGTYAGAQAHKKDGEELCAPCLNARRLYQKRLQIDHTNGRKRRVDPAPAVKHAQNLMDRYGVSRAWIGERAGISRSAIMRLFSSPGTDVRIEVSTVRAILAVRPPSAYLTPVGYRHRFGVARRIAALNAMGWTRAEIATRVGTTPQAITTLLTGKRGVEKRPDQWVQATTWQKVDKVYQELCMTFGPSERARRYAERRGYVPPLGWTNIDDPDEVPAAWEYRERHIKDSTTVDIDPVAVQRILDGEWHLPATPGERTEVIRGWVERGGSLNQLNRLVPWKLDRYWHTTRSPYCHADGCHDSRTVSHGAIRLCAIHKRLHVPRRRRAQPLEEAA